MKPRYPIPCALLLAAGAASAAVTLGEGEVYTWEGLTLFAPSGYWTINEGEGAAALYRTEEDGGGYVAGNLLLEAPDGWPAGTFAEGNREATIEALVEHLADRCRARFGQVYELERCDADGAEPAAALFFSDGGRRVRAYAFWTRSGVYLLYLTFDPAEEERLAPELDRLVGTLSFR